MISKCLVLERITGLKILSKKKVVVERVLQPKYCLFLVWTVNCQVLGEVVRKMGLECSRSEGVLP